jgi:hypothetical protein
VRERERTQLPRRDDRIAGAVKVVQSMPSQQLHDELCADVAPEGKSLSEVVIFNLALENGKPPEDSLDGGFRGAPGLDHLLDLLRDNGVVQDQPMGIEHVARRSLDLARERAGGVVQALDELGLRPAVAQQLVLRCPRRTTLLD